MMNDYLNRHHALSQTAGQLVEALQTAQIKTVLAESCTCGQAAAALGAVSGVSRFLCGSWVVYRPATKIQWLGIDPALLRQHSAESPACSQALATAALRRTPEAQLALAVTGDLDPTAAPEKQGRIFLAAALRHISNAAEPSVLQQAYQLQSATRVLRQLEAAQLLLAFGCQVLAAAPPVQETS